MRQQPAPSAQRDAGTAARAPRPRQTAKIFALRLVSALCAALAIALLFAPQLSSGANPAQTQPPDQPAATPTPTLTPTGQQRLSQAAPSGASAGAGTATPPPTPSPFPDSKVLRAYKLGREAEARSGIPEQMRSAAEAGLNDIIVLDVQNLKALLERQKCLKPGGQKEPGCDEGQRRIILYIEGRPLKGLQPESGAPELKDGEFGTLRYHLQRPVKTDEVSQGDVDDTKEHWADLLGLGYDDLGHLWTREVSISVGLTGEYPIPTEVRSEGAFKKFHLLRVRFERFLIWAGLLVGFAIAFYFLARKGDIIRDRKPIVWERGNKQRKAYSLTRTQIAWWTFFVAFGFIFIWLVTGQRDLSPSVLVLLGISVITTIGSIAIDRSRSFAVTGDASDSTNAELVDLMHEKEKMEEELTRDEGKVPEAEFKAKLDSYKALVAGIRRKFPTAFGWKNVRFDIDILSDANGVSIHRFQMVLWTVILGLVFIHEVFTRLAMPDFSQTLLLLMGISNGTYLFGKASEPQATPPPTGGVSSPP